ncbi:hypothetical protein [Acuticoccus mangrovi]|uniref:Uncharacterized protein n=1 Tax=Acuticoccus mangrovi TaxID=2796142 RepID=A0A934ITD2_9HYPH|nr:hypothetical protein [Acuticoccus mangrovi]
MAASDPHGPASGDGPADVPHPAIERERKRRQRGRSIAIALVLGGLVVIFYVITILQMANNAAPVPQ